MQARAIFLLGVAILFALTPLMLPGFDGYDPEDFPVQILRPAVQPAGYAFSIWLLIYAALIAHGFAGLVLHAKSDFWDRPRLALMASMALGILWVALAENHPVAASATILLMLVAALYSLLQTADMALSIEGRRGGIFYLTPVAIFAGWVTAAAGASSGIALSGLGWLPDTQAALLAILAVLVLAALFQIRIGRVPEYGLAVIWALIAIVVANWAINAAVYWTALAGALVMGAVILIACKRSA